ncbi:uncharacterized protein LOC107013559 [Solanum pennellii]|uniref:Uncharacterized protein LOC107013559 n=1 Tax=Solanum pennellii TaxID=28526 RepID=A0ABM1GBX9_SOLPN|nr:uncharacterized protein LOC107013559 [Solanum pennellii]
MSNVEIRSTIHSLTQVFSTQVDKDARVQMNPNAKTTASRIKDFTRMNPRTFFGSKVEEDPQGFIDEVFKVLDAMGVSSQEMAELAAYQLKDVAQLWSAMLIPSMDILVSWFMQNKLRSKTLSKLPQEGKCGRSYVEKPLCAKCDKRHDGKCLVGTVNCYGCGKSGHMKIDYPMMKAQGRENSQSQTSAPNPYASKKNRFYVLQSRSDKESSPDVVTGKQPQTLHSLPAAFEGKSSGSYHLDKRWEEQLDAAKSYLDKAPKKMK